jgi:molecular chaperone GrpE
MSSPEERNGPVIRDLRRIDPTTGRVRDPGQPGRPGQPGQGGPAQQGGSARGPAKPRPGRHAVSRPGGGSAGPETAAAPGGALGSAAPRQGQGRGAPDREDAAPSAAEQRAAEQLAERTADLQRVTAEYANYRKRVERDRVAVREQALANVLSGLLPVLDDIGRAREHGELVGGFKSVADSLEAAVAKLGLESFGDNGEPFDPNVHEALMHSYSSDVTEPTCVEILQPGYRVGERILRPARVAVAEPDGTGEADLADEDDEIDEPDGPWGPEGPGEFRGSPGPGNPRGSAHGAGPRDRRNNH